MKTLLVSSCLLCCLVLCACPTIRHPPAVRDSVPHSIADGPPVDSNSKETVAIVNQPAVTSSAEASHEDSGPIAPPRIPLGELAGKLTDAYFNLDQDSLRPDARAALQSDASVVSEILSGEPDNALVVEGHCDERGSAEYNLALGARRAEVSKDFLVGLGVPGRALTAVSYGKERPQCTEANEGVLAEEPARPH